jgi:hypothetical protein
MTVPLATFVAAFGTVSWVELDAGSVGQQLTSISEAHRREPRSQPRSVFCASNRQAPR